ncbi:hypothetical protein HMI49_14535 [Corallococcus exercitus]|uniref:Uncharacterized protein n=1 Tax=Corallococcus exercitus TaxID=2316736 RepID=A0A7Y4NS54_9BACT|nr:hypothetical protein [Corallococcus exercitus]NOK34416.1 hypothetical protein [Corallococcus exercitus]
MLPVNVGVTTLNCEGCSKTFQAHMGCAKSLKAASLCASCQSSSTGSTGPSITILSTLHGTPTEHGIELIKDGRTCNACGASYDQGRDACRILGISGDSKNAHCVIPQTILKRTGRLVFEFYNLVCNAPSGKTLRKTQKRAHLRLKSVPRLPIDLCWAPQEAICSEVQAVLNELVEIEERPTDSSGVEKEFFYFDQVTTSNEGSGLFNRAKEVIGQGNLGDFYTGKQCGLCESIQGDLPILERYFVLVAFEKAVKLLPRFVSQYKETSRRAVQRMSSFEVAEESKFNAFARKTKQGPEQLRRLRDTHVNTMEQLQTELADLWETHDSEQAVHLGFINDPLVRAWVEALVKRDFQIPVLRAMLQVYVGKHLYRAIERHANPYAFLMSWMDVELIQEIHARLEKIAAQYHPLPAEVALDLWPLFLQFYAASMFSECSSKPVLPEVERLMTFHDKHIHSVRRSTAWEQWSRTV